ncbi:hypothetical protein LZ31DRAFT_307542 [Colletotrichum somersetense]|nr:hypothetical protein LZ31DRAFT_307542 [Colletotrichum somersetense]
MSGVEGHGWSPEGTGFAENLTLYTMYRKWHYRICILPCCCRSCIFPRCFALCTHPTGTGWVQGSTTGYVPDSEP